MFLKRVVLQHFRNFTQQTIELGETTLLVGKNGAGKTSVIEAIHMLGSGQSFRATKIDQMIKFDQELGRVVGLALEDGGKDREGDRLEIKLTRGVVQGKKAQKRLYSINDAGKRKKDFIGRIKSVVFRPEDMRLIEGSPSRRRNFVDGVLSLSFPIYAQSLHTYEQALKRFNKLLFSVREGEQPRTVLQYWEMMLLKHGQIVTEHREKFFNFLHSVEFPFPFDVRYEPSLVNEERMEEYRGRAIAAGHALIGPHKDDFMVLFANDGMKNRELDAYGSRGQQRLGVLWLKLGELKFLEKMASKLGGGKPMLLLDDIFSELDEKAKEMVMGLIKEYQTVLTTADERMAKELKKEAEPVVIEL